MKLMKLEIGHLMAELPPDVRDRAAQAAVRVFLSRPYSDTHDFRPVVDAVAEVLAAEQPPEIDWKTAYDQREVEINQILTDSGGQIMQLRARVDELTAALRELIDTRNGGGRMTSAWIHARAVLAAGVVTETPPLDAFRNLPDWVPDLTPEQHHARYLEMLREREAAAVERESE